MREEPDDQDTTVRAWPWFPQSYTRGYTAGYAQGEVAPPVSSTILVDLEQLIRTLDYQPSSETARSFQSITGRLDEIEERLDRLERSDAQILEGVEHIRTMLQLRPGVKHDEGSVTKIDESAVSQSIDSLDPYDITIPDRVAVSDYLIQYPDVMEILPFVCKLARDAFDDDTQLVLAVYIDPEIRCHYLALYIRQKQYSEDILDTIRNIRAQYADKAAGKQGIILVTTDFDNPR